MPKFVPKPVPYSLYKQLLGRYNRLFSQWQALLEENHRLRMEAAARPAKIN
jgi:hypothetical protein